MKFFHWLGHDHHDAKRKEIERAQKALDEQRALAFACPVVDEADMSE